MRFIVGFAGRIENPCLAQVTQRREDIQEVLNYRAALRQAERLLATLPLSQRVIREAHQVLLAGVRGENKAPGEFRRIPNWIGPPNCAIEMARFVLIGADELPDAMRGGRRNRGHPSFRYLLQRQFR